jgi:hypothetical protein
MTRTDTRAQEASRRASRRGLREEDAVLEAMLAGWARQQPGGRGLAPRTVGQRQAVVRQCPSRQNDDGYLPR